MTWGRNLDRHMTTKAMAVIIPRLTMVLVLEMERTRSVGLFRVSVTVDIKNTPFDK